MTGSMDVMIETGDISKRFGSTVALARVSLQVKGGRVLGVLGPNGAGKTTLVRVLTTLMAPDSGSAHVAGHDVVRDAASVRPLIGLAGQYAAVDENLTGRENLEFVGQLYHIPRRERRERAQEILQKFGLVDAADRLVRTYSGGMRRRLDLGASLVARPPILILDEPTTGLDPRSRVDLWRSVEALVADGTTVLLTTQYLEEVDRLADSIVVIDRGAVIAHGTADELKDRLGGDRLEMVVATAARFADAVEIASRLPDGSGPSVAPVLDAAQRRITVPTRHGTLALTAAIRSLDEAGIALENISLHRPSLDDVFLALTGSTAEDRAPADAPRRRRGLPARRSRS